MNFLFKSISGFQFPYSLASEPTVRTSIWEAFDGHRKSDSQPVTVFSFERRPGNAVLETLITNAIRHFKILKLPGLVKVLDVLETSATTSYVVTERVTPLETQGLSSQALSLGIFQLAETLTCLHSQAQVVLGTLSAGTVFVNERGEWRVFGLELCSKIAELHLLKQNAGPYASLVADTSLHITPISSANADAVLLAKFISSICKPLPSDWTSLLPSMEQGRLTLAQFMTRFMSTRPFQSTLIIIYQDLKEFHIKDPQGKIVAMADLQRKIMEDPESLRGCTPGFVEHYLIPEIAQCIATILEAQKLQAGSMATTSTVSFVASLLELTCSSQPVTDSKPVFDKYVKPLILENFKQPDRQVRFLLLVYFSSYLSKMTNSEVSDRIFPHFVQGLADTDVTMRIQTLKRIPDIVPMITERQLNNDLLRHLAKTQVDADVEIRTWTILTISGLSKKLSPSNNRSGILATAFTKSLKDPQVKPRLAALHGLETSLELFDIDTIANKILTVIAPGLLDKNKQVRSKAKDLFRLYLSKLEAEADRIPTADNEHIDVDFESNNRDEATVIRQFMETLRLSTPTVMPQAEANPLSGPLESSDWVANDAGWEDTDEWDNESPMEQSFPRNTDLNVAHAVRFSDSETITKEPAGKVKIQKTWNDELEDDDWDSWNKPAKLQTSSKISSTARMTAPKKVSSTTVKKIQVSKIKESFDVAEHDDQEDGWGDEW
ncbi:LAME_0H13058g1_1 [Lachancea meyersii CBS 8951]|uniref:LAME_0H13058g1_1 n=1 Tax=Lachancea meyersii CBS 8951 TaxID=1266667 RepID=A0A1G4KGW4_9SACH|nr:LAME_0H13058g1_1 [Lachancea meyersii CBS 8951]